MSYVAYEALVVTASSSGAITTLTSKTFTGFVHAVRYVPTNTSTVLGISSGGGGSMAITAAVSGLSVLSLTDASSANLNTYYPRAATVALTSADSTGSAPIALFNERLQVVMTSGSTTADTKQATLYFYIS